MNEEFAIVVTADARVFTFSFRYGGEFHHEGEEGFPYTISRDQVKIVRWDELRTPAEQLAYKKKIDEALTVLDEERHDQ